MPFSVDHVKRSGALLCATAAAVLGSSVPISRSVLGYPILSGQALRYALAATALGLLVRLGAPAGRAGRSDLLRLTALAATGLVGFNVCLLAALRHADAPVVGTVVGGTPLLLAVLGPALQGRRPSPRLVGAATVVVAGAALVEGGGHADAAGLGYALAALAYLGLVLTVLAFLAWYAGLARLGVERAGMCFGLMPVAALTATAVFDGRVPPVAQVAGVLLVGAGLSAGLMAKPRLEPGPALAPSLALAPGLALDGADRVGVGQGGLAQRPLGVEAVGSRGRDDGQ